MSRTIHCTLCMGPWVLTSCITKAGKALPMLLQTSWSTLRWYSSEIPRLPSTSDEISIVQMRRTHVYGPLISVWNSEPPRLGICAANIPRPSVDIEREGFTASSCGDRCWPRSKDSPFLMRWYSSRFQEGSRSAKGLLSPAVHCVGSEPWRLVEMDAGLVRSIW